MKRTIFPNDFSPYYPMGILPCPMYVDVANRIYDKIKEMDIDLPDADKLKKEIAINASIYYEDKMSDIGLWNAFVSKHLQAYSRPLPFFDDFDILDRYDVNAKEVELLVWFVLSRNFGDRFLNPLAMGEDAANVIMEILTEDEKVEVNESLREFIYNTDTTNDYFKLKHVLIWLRRSYLLCSPLSEKRFKDYEESYLEMFSEKESVYYAETAFSKDTEIGPMAVLPHLWLADMYFENDMSEVSEALKNLKYCLQDVFEVTDADSKYAVLKSTKGEEYKLKNVYPDIFCKGSYICTALVKFADNDWEINGVVFNSERNVYDKMHERHEELKRSQEHVFPLYLKRAKGEHLAFFENTNQLKDWLKNIAPELVAKVCHRLPNGPMAAFISEKSGLVFVPRMNHAMKCSNNPYYGKCDERKMQQETMDAVINKKAMHPELLHYLIENKMLPNGDLSYNYPSELGKKIFTRNIDFIARQHRLHYYYDHSY